MASTWLNRAGSPRRQMSQELLSSSHNRKKWKKENFARNRSTTGMTVLFCKCIPDHTLALGIEDDRNHGYKVMKDRITLSLGCNGKEATCWSPAWLGSSSLLDVSNTSTGRPSPLYNYSCRAWMTASIFKDLFQREYVPAVRRHLRKQGKEEAVLVLDNYTVHPADELNSKDGKISAMFLLKTIIYITQPPNPNPQGDITIFKGNFCK